jgi:hypothetical protein
MGPPEIGSAARWSILIAGFFLLSSQLASAAETAGTGAYRLINPSASALSSSAKSLLVLRNVTTFVEGFYEYRFDCTSPGLDTGTVTTKPLHGTVTFETVTVIPHAGQPCAGVPLPAREAFYTWTDTNPHDTTDFFHLHWVSSYGIILEDSDWSIELGPLLNLVSPFLLGAKGDALQNLDLATLLPALPNLATAAATGLTADGTSAAIALAATSTTSDVTFTTTNGTSLLPYDPNFLQKLPTVGSSTLVIPAAKLMNIGGLLYAAALVQTPPPAVTPLYASSIVVTAQQDSETKQALLDLVPPPVLFVHGLWGNNQSLLFHKEALAKTAPWSNYPNQLVAMQYPGAASFYYPVSLMDMGTDVASILGAVQSKGIVDSRIDVVAHSMGGLLVRAYSGGTCTTTGYRSLVNRCQGQFHTIVTLDTPEAGSGLATYLLGINKLPSRKHRRY